MNRFLPACRTIAEIACRRNKYVGFEVTDPFDGARVRLNPVRTRPHAVTSSETKISVNVPLTRHASKGWIPATPNADGDYPVDQDALRRMIAPCLTHTLDANFAGYMVEQLNALGVRDVVSIYDCWMRATDAARALYDAVPAAGEPWFRSLGPMYEAISALVGSQKDRTLARASSQTGSQTAFGRVYQN